MNGKDKKGCGVIFFQLTAVLILEKKGKLAVSDKWMISESGTYQHRPGHGKAGPLDNFFGLESQSGPFGCEAAGPLPGLGLPLSSAPIPYLSWSSSSFLSND